MNEDVSTIFRYRIPQALDLLLLDEVPHTVPQWLVRVEEMHHMLLHTMLRTQLRPPLWGYLSTGAILCSN